ncbi:MAG: hypothetical protein ACWA5U_01695 [bacterium]
MKTKYRINQRTTDKYYLALWTCVALILLNVVLTINGLSPFELLAQQK